ncbi:hypothetical protein K445DRAFT_157290 [Daldinia sp. EC12]|nr:hypothetical protein K445DRAFT_157290 [Daldinia sp. EC12]
MSPITRLATVMLLFTGITNAHFTVEHPPTIGQFNDADISKVSTTDFHIDGDVIAIGLKSGPFFNRAAKANFATLKSPSLESSSARKASSGLSLTPSTDFYTK